MFLTTVVGEQSEVDLAPGMVSKSSITVIGPEGDNQHLHNEGLDTLNKISREVKLGSKDVKDEKGGQEGREKGCKGKRAIEG